MTEALIARFAQLFLFLAMPSPFCRAKSLFYKPYCWAEFQDLPIWFRSRRTSPWVWREPIATERFTQALDQVAVEVRRMSPNKFQGIATSAT